MQEQTHRSMEQNRVPRNRQLIFGKEAKAIQWRKDAFSTNGAGTIEHPSAKK